MIASRWIVINRCVFVISVINYDLLIKVLALRKYYCIFNLSKQKGTTDNEIT
jgi:hypothetical protein